METDVKDKVVEAVERTLGQPAESWRRLAGGANNTVWKVTTRERAYLAKHYFTHQQDPRDRLGAEFGMLTFLWNHGVRRVPQPLRAEPASRIALYEFIEGEPPRAGEISWPDVQQLIELLAEMWNLREREGADRLPSASDSGFSIRAHVEAVGQRLGRLQAALATAGAEAGAREFVAHQVAPLLERVGRGLEDECRRRGLDIHRALTRRESTLSPADHGFHNTIRRQNGRLVFIDFEYAGWDDPAQMIINACHQPAVPLPEAFRSRLVSELMTRLPAGPELADRVRMLNPLLGLKWCLIMMNEFVPVAEHRRRFSGHDPIAHRKAQLEKARQKLEEVQTSLG